MVWYSHLFQNFPQFIVIRTVKCFGIVNKAEIDECLFMPLSIFIGGKEAQEGECICILTANSH